MLSKVGNLGEIAEQQPNTINATQQYCSTLSVIKKYKVLYDCEWAESNE